MVRSKRNAQIFPFLGTLLLVSSASAQNNLPNLLEFSAKPNHCVALRKGLTCHQRIWLTFKAPQAGDYCLHVENQDKPLQCWSNVSSGKYRYRLESSENLTFYLHHKTDRVADVEVSIAWVYKNKGRTRNSWRIF